MARCSAWVVLLQSTRRERGSVQWEWECFGGLEGDGLAVLAEDGAEGVGELADGGVGLDGGEEVRHQVGAGAGGLGDAAQGGGVARWVAALAEGAEALDLAGFEGGVDALGGDGFLGASSGFALR